MMRNTTFVFYRRYDLKDHPMLKGWQYHPGAHLKVMFGNYIRSGCGSLQFALKFGNQRCQSLSRVQVLHTQPSNCHGIDTVGAALYVHWPYCARRCTYCNFNKYISRHVDNERMARCLEVETTTLLQLSGVDTITSIFFGGGTPSLALPSTIERVINCVKQHSWLAPDTEITIEVNPTHLETKTLREFRNAGVNRVSVGVQALNETDLKLLGRNHSVEEALKCIKETSVLYPGRVSVDIIFGRPGQTLESWIKELQQLLPVCDRHVSLYQLTLERGTQLFKWVQEEKLVLPDTDSMADMYREAVEMMEAHGFRRYEVSNFAKEGAESRHNQVYWQGKEYIGVGPGAHGRFKPRNKTQGSSVTMREARVQTLEPDNWMWEVENYGHATRKVIQQTLLEQLEELVAQSLRTTEGLTEARWRELCGYSLRQVFGSSESVRDLCQRGLLQISDGLLRVTSDGMMVLDSIVYPIY